MVLSIFTIVVTALVQLFTSGAKAELESRGVEFDTETIDSGVCWQAIFRDPDGNALAIHHRYAARTPPQN